MAPAPAARPRPTFVLTTEGGVKATYQVALLPPFTQHRLLTKFLPPVAARAGVVSDRGTTALVAAMISALGDIPEADHDMVIDTLLSTVSRRADGEGNWAQVWVPGSKTFMFDDIGLQDMYAILREVVEHTYGNFFVKMQAEMLRMRQEREALESGTKP